MNDLMGLGQDIKVTASGPKILLFDIETTPIEAYTWGPKWETNLIEFIEYSRILSYSAKWLDGSHITKGWPDYRGYKKGTLNDESIVKDLWGLFNDADVIIAQNGKQFDIKMANARFAYFKLPPPSPYKIIDTRNEARKYLRLPSNKLDDLCDYFGIGRKVEHEGFPLWKDCMAGDTKAWTKMKRYNKHDVVLLEKLYLKLRPWMNNHPNMGMFSKKNVVCPKCGSDKLQARGFAINTTTRYRRFQCQDCGGWGRVNGNVQDIKPAVNI